jgi:phosphoglycerate dehydrogenase-like enzyme
MTSVLIIDTQPESIRREYLDHLHEKFPQLTVNLVDNHNKVGPYVADADVVIAFGPMMADHVLREGPKIKWIHCLTTGTDGVDDLPSLRPDILITSSHGIHADTVSEHAMMLMLALSRHLPDHVRAQERHKWATDPARLLHGKNVGIFGVGAIGEGLAVRLKAMGMIVHGIDPVRRRVPGIDKWHPWTDAEALMPQLDYVVLLMSLTPKTRGVFDAKLLGKMKPTAYLINVGRGGLCDENALIDILRNGKIAGAGLDAFVKEPLPEDSPLWDLKNVIVTPHNAGPFDEYAKYCFPILDENLRRFLAGDTKNMINLVEHQTPHLEPTRP